MQNTRGRTRILRRLVVCVLLLARYVNGQACSADGTTCDTHERCPHWKEQGECFRERDYMTRYCPVSCAEESLDILGEEENVVQEHCEDAHFRCPIWAELGECDNSSDMLAYCAKSCGTCHMAAQLDGLCRDKDENCRFWASTGECSTNPTFMANDCAHSCGACKKAGEFLFPEDEDEEENETSQQIVGEEASDDWIQKALKATRAFGEIQVATGSEKRATLDVVSKSIQYMATKEVQSLSGAYKQACRNNHELCSFWAQLGECEANQAYMKLACAPACGTCTLLDMEKRCPPLPEDTEPALRPGALNKMFERLVATAPGNITDMAEKERLADFLEGMPEYTVNVLSGPRDGLVTEVSVHKDKELPPWVVTFDNFLSEEECDKLIEIGNNQGYKRSEDVGTVKVDGTVHGVKSQGRTSENAWCSSRDGCRESALPQSIHERIAKVLEIPVESSEDFQILRYEIGQFYEVHHDYIPNQKDRQCGPRILTFFIYLSDLPEGGGGGTDFPKLGLTVQPKKGSALLWPSVYNAEPFTPDKRTEHQALPVQGGTKYAMNAWIHMYDYIGPKDRGCS